MQLTSPLKWAGSKRWLVPQLTPYWHWYCNQYGNQTRLVEPFAGACNVAFGLESKRALLSDSNPHLIAFHQFCQRGGQIPLRFVYNREYYCRLRNTFNNLATSNPQSEMIAWLFYYFNRCGYNGLCRYNQQGGFNTPFGRYKKVEFEYDFSAYAPVMRGWELVSGDFSEIELQESDLLYIDPPYDGCKFTQYDGNKFTRQVELVEWAAEHRGPVIASNNPTEAILKLYQSKGFSIAIIPGRRNSISSKTASRTQKFEMFATRNIPVELMQLEVAA